MGGGGSCRQTCEFYASDYRWRFGEPVAPQRQQMSGVPAIVSHISSSDLLDRCDLSESLGETTVLPLTFTLDNVFFCCFFKDTPPLFSSTPPSVRNSHL